MQEWNIGTEGLQYQTPIFLFVLHHIKHTFTPSYFPESTMVHRAFVLFICVGLLAFQPHEVCGMRSTDLALRRGSRDQPLMVKDRVLKAAEVNSLNTDKKSAPVNKTFDSNQSSKRQVRRGSDPIHNRS